MLREIKTIHQLPMYSAGLFHSLAQIALTLSPPVPFFRYSEKTNLPLVVLPFVISAQVDSYLLKPKLKFEVFFPNLVSYRQSTFSFG